MGFRGLLSFTIAILPLLGTTDCQTCDGCIVNPDSATCEELNLQAVPICLPETIKSLYLWNNNIVLNSSSLDHLPSLEEVYFDYNGLNSIPEDLFRNQPNLTIVSFLDNKLDIIPVNIFDNNPLILLLDVSRNLLKDVDLLFENTNLQILYAYSNAIESLPNAISVSDKISTLDLSYNSIETLDPQLFASITNCSLWVESNPWNCDCTITNLLKLFKIQNIVVQIDPVCATPAEFAGTNWSELPDLCI